MKPVIIGYDMVSPLGTDMKAQWHRAANGESGIGPLTRFPLKPGFPVRIAGQVGEIHTETYPFLSPRKMALWPSPVFKYAMLVVYRALENSSLEITPTLAPRIGITFSSAVGGQDALVAADRRMVAENKLPPPYANPNSCINMVGGKISILTGATGPIVSTITACATGVTSMIVGAMLITQGRADAVICGAVDFPLVEPVVAGFETMNGAYTPKPGHAHDPPARASRPFSIDRRGFVISEGAACIIIAAPEFALAHGLDPKAEIAGWSMTSDAHHFVAPRQATVSRCIAESIRTAGVHPGDIDLVNAHGTSTRIGDAVEYAALREVFGDDPPPVSANKSQTGHAMGASSAIESILAMEGMAKNTALPIINYTPDPALNLGAASRETRDLNQKYVLKNAFGFGGCNSCVVFRRIG